MDREDLKKILEEVDVLLFLAGKGERERKFFAWHMFVWGLYAFFNMSLWLLFPKVSHSIPGTTWFHTLFVAFYFSAVPSHGWVKPLLWFLPYVAALLAGQLGLGAAVGVTIVGIFLTSTFIYGGKKRDRSISIVAYMGIMWGLLFAAFWWSYVLHPSSFSNLAFNLWITYVFGVGILLSGVIFRRFFLLGLLILFVLPALAKLGTSYLFTGYALSALIMAIMGFTLYLKR